MDIVTLNQAKEPVTTSLAIALGTEVQHKNLMELIKTHLDRLERFGGVAFETQPFETAGGTQKREVAILNERQATLLITYMRNSEVVLAFKDRLVDAFFRLVDQQRRAAMPTFTLKQALKQALESEEAREIAEQKVAELSTKVESMQAKVKTLDAIAVDEDKAMSLRDAANTLNLPQNEFIKLCIENGIIYRAWDKSLRPHAVSLNKGWLQYKLVVCANEQERPQTLVTHKGIVHFKNLGWKSRKRADPFEGVPTLEELTGIKMWD